MHLDIAQLERTGCMLDSCVPMRSNLDDTSIGQPYIYSSGAVHIHYVGDVFLQGRPPSSSIKRDAVKIRQRLGGERMVPLCRLNGLPTIQLVPCRTDYYCTSSVSGSWIRLGC